MPVLEEAQYMEEKQFVYCVLTYYQYRRCKTTHSPLIFYLGNSHGNDVSQVQPGQRISIYLYDFALRTNGTALTTQENHKVCRVYATLREKTSIRSVTVCGGRERIQHVYSSTTDQVEMRILNSKTPHKPVYFMFKYEGNAVFR